jgi:Putative zinc-finger
MMGMPSCREVTRMLAEGEFRNAPRRTRWMVRLHLAMCRHCGRFARQMNLIAQALKALVSRRPDEFNRPDVAERIIARLRHL